LTFTNLLAPLSAHPRQFRGVGEHDNACGPRIGGKRVYLRIGLTSSILSCSTKRGPVEEHAARTMQQSMLSFALRRYFKIKIPSMTLYLTVRNLTEWLRHAYFLFTCLWVARPSYVTSEASSMRHRFKPWTTPALESIDTAGIVAFNEQAHTLWARFTLLRCASQSQASIAVAASPASMMLGWQEASRFAASPDAPPRICREATAYCGLDEPKQSSTPRAWMSSGEEWFYITSSCTADPQASRAQCTSRRTNLGELRSGLHFDRCTAYIAVLACVPPGQLVWGM
jgi:hypothetical protein